MQSRLARAAFDATVPLAVLLAGLQLQGVTLHWAAMTSFALLGAGAGLATRSAAGRMVEAAIFGLAGASLAAGAVWALGAALGATPAALVLFAVAMTGHGGGVWVQRRLATVTVPVSSR